MFRKRLFFLAALCAFVGSLFAQDVYPEATPIMIYTDDDGFEVTDEVSYSGGAPFVARFEVELENEEGYDVRYEWQFIRDGQDTPFLTRFDATTEYTFTESGTFYVNCLITFARDGEELEYEMDTPFIVNIANSKLEVPNAFTPNGDGINDVFKVKDGYESIVEFHAAVFTRSGKRLYEWTDPADGWDGTMNGNGGTNAPDGAYYFVMKARGADGLKYDRKMVINLLRGYNESTTGAGG